MDDEERDGIINSSSQSMRVSSGIRIIICLGD